MVIADLSANGPKVLIADDDPIVRRTVSRYLTNQYQVRIVEDGAHAIAEYLEDPPDLVIIDHQMPDMTGSDALAAIRARLAGRPQAPALLMSGVADPSQISRSLAAGVTDFIAKPFLREELLAKVEALLEGHRLRREAELHRAQIAELHARRDLDAAAASAVLDRMLGRGEFDPERTQRLAVPAGTFSGDVIFGATTAAGTYRWMVGDVTGGHTLSRALVTIPISMIFYASAQRSEPLVDTLATLERELAQLLPAQMFCAAAICELDRATGRLDVWNGGLPPVMVRRRGGRGVAHVESFDPPLAVARGIAWPREVHTLGVSPGDRVLVFSDGLVEACDANGVMLGIDAAAAIVAAGDASTAFARLVERWRVHAHGRHDDDVSLIEVEV